MRVDTVEIFRPGEPVFDPDSGEYHPGPDQILYTGAGAIFAAGGPGLVLSLEGQAYADETFYNRRRLRKHINWGYLTPHETRLRYQQDQTLAA
ncbi:DUF6093 family protein [Streptomyces sp. NBC_01589]|uniref:DUF6093 family protein n=1 Tax=Streptomyces sp. NBC_01589 TaxID=2975886 RepID=UPI00386344C2